MLWAGVAPAETLRLALFHTDLSRDGPGLMLRDIRKEHDQVDAIRQVVRAVDPDVLVLADIDYDLNTVGLNALADFIGGYPHRFADRPNRGLPSGRDLDDDGRVGGPGDTEGYADFQGQGGLGVLSKIPFDLTGVIDFSSTPWQELAGHNAVQDGFDPTRFSKTAHWVLPVQVTDGAWLSLMIWHATAPVFDGPEDRNGWRNHDETAFWLSFLNGELPVVPPDNFVLLGVANADPFDGESRPTALRRLLRHPRVQDPKPISAGARAAADPDHTGPAEQDTVDWPSGPDRPGNLRVDYVLPSSELKVTDAGVFWPTEDTALGIVAQRASRHRMVWVDVMMDAARMSNP